MGINKSLHLKSARLAHGEIRFATAPCRDVGSFDAPSARHIVEREAEG